ncbi:MAG: hypothetical protein PHI06_11800 [Desulfobulbaceae bacterium]|nr:hypothetical protein [Desulfobulbaceae bacterium]
MQQILKQLMMAFPKDQDPRFAIVDKAQDESSIFMQGAGHFACYLFANSHTYLTN